MKTKYSFVLAAGVLFPLIFLVADQAQNPLWKGKIEYTDGIMIIKNPRKPLYEEEVVEFEEELSIGEPEGSKEYMFSVISSIDVDSDGNIYILDVKEAHIKVFDSDGRFVRIIGKRGQGPGELHLPHTVQVTAKNEVVVFDPLPQKLLFFSKDGKYKKSIPTTKLFGYPLINSEGYIISLVRNEGIENPKYALHRLDLQLSSLSFYYSYPKPDFTQQGINPFSIDLRWTVNNSSKIICGMPDKDYDLRILSPQGNLVRRITKDYTPVKISDEEIKRIMKGISDRDKYSIPKYHGAFRFIVADDESRIFVCTWEKTEDRSASYFDVFDTEGKYIAQIPIKYSMLLSRPLIFKGNKLHLINEDDDGYQYVKRCKVTWKI